MTSDKPHVRRKVVFAAVISCTVFYVAIISVKYLMPTPSDEAYCDKTLAMTGLDFSQMSLNVEHEFCEDQWVDAVVYFKLKVKGNDTSGVINRLRAFPQYDGGIDSYSPPPEWWKPDPGAIKIVYFNDDNGSAVIIAYVDPPADGFFTIYIQVIPF